LGQLFALQGASGDMEFTVAAQWENAMSTRADKRSSERPSPSALGRWSRHIPSGHDLPSFLGSRLLFTWAWLRNRPRLSSADKLRRQPRLSTAWVSLTVINEHFDTSHPW